LRFGFFVVYLQRNSNEALCFDFVFPFKKQLEMCTVTLSFDRNDQEAAEKLAALLSTGLFEQIDLYDDINIDYSDPSLYEPDPSLPEINHDMSPEELEQLIIEDIHSIYQNKVAYAV